MSAAAKTAAWDSTPDGATTTDWASVIGGVVTNAAACRSAGVTAVAVISTVSGVSPAPLASTSAVGTTTRQDASLDATAVGEISAMVGGVPATAVAGRVLSCAASTVPDSPGTSATGSTLEPAMTELAVAGLAAAIARS